MFNSLRQHVYIFFYILQNIDKQFTVLYGNHDLQVNKCLTLHLKIIRTKNLQGNETKTTIYLLSYYVSDLAEKKPTWDNLQLTINCFWYCIYKS